MHDVEQPPIPAQAKRHMRDAYGDTVLRQCLMHFQQCEACLYLFMHGSEKPATVNLLPNTMLCNSAVLQSN